MKKIKYSSFYTYIIIGLLTNFINIAIFEILFIYLKLSSSISLLTASVLATFLNLLLNKKYTFKYQKSIRELKLIFKYLVGYFISIFFIKLFFEILFLNLIKISFIAYSISVMSGSIFFYLWQKRIVFKK